MSKSKFVDLWPKGSNSFRANNPEAVLSAEVGGKQVILGSQLTKPFYDLASKSFGYDVRIVKFRVSVKLGETRFKNLALFIDGWKSPAGPAFQKLR